MGEKFRRVTHHIGLLPGDFRRTAQLAVLKPLAVEIGHHRGDERQPTIGFEREHGGHQRILAVTANAMKGDRDRCLESGMDGYLSKPIDLDRLTRATVTDTAGLLARRAGRIPKRFWAQASSPTGSVSSWTATGCNS